MSKKKVPATQDDELFVRKTKLISESTKKTLEIHHFIKEIEDPENNHREIESPDFTLAGQKFWLGVIPDDMPGCFAVYFGWSCDEDVMVSLTLKEASGVERSYELKKYPAGNGSYCFEQLSQEEYREWAKAHGDVLRLEVVVTVHSKAEGDCWTR